MNTRRTLAVPGTLPVAPLTTCLVTSFSDRLSSVRRAGALSLYRQAILVFASRHLLERLGIQSPKNLRFRAHLEGRGTY